MEDEEMLKSPVLKSASKKGWLKADCIASPILSKKRKRRPDVDDSMTPQLTHCSPKFKTNKHHVVPSQQAVARSPVIDTFWSPPRSIARIQENSPIMSPVISSSSRGLKPKALFIDIQLPSPLLTETGRRTMLECDDEFADVEEFPASCPSSESSTAISQVSSFNPESFFLTPEKKTSDVGSSSKEGSCCESVRKKKQFAQNGMARKLDRLISRQESDCRIWRFQRNKQSGSDAAVETRDDLHLLVESTSVGQVHCFCRCRKMNSSREEEEEPASDQDDGQQVDVLFDTPRYNKLQISHGDVLCLHPPWQTIVADGGRTLLLGANLLTKMETRQLKQQQVDSSLTPNIATTSTRRNKSAADRTTRETTLQATRVRK